MSFLLQQVKARGTEIATSEQMHLSSQLSVYKINNFLKSSEYLLYAIKIQKGTSLFLPPFQITFNILFFFKKLLETAV